MSKLLEKIETDKEILSTMPKNNKKNIAKYIQKVQELKKEYETEKEKTYKEISKNYKKIVEITENTEIAKLKSELEEISTFLQLIDEIQTSYEKMGLDKKIYKLNRFYKENLESVNSEILSCINKFAETGIALTKDDFDYSIYTHEYMETFFKEINDISSDTLKEKFENMYWKCPDLIIHIELNLRHIYINNKKNIDKYYEKQKQNVLNKLNADTTKIYEKYKDTKIKLYDIIDADKCTIINQFLDGQLVEKDYEEDKIRQEYNKVLAKGITQNTSKKAIKEISENAIKFINSLEEYKNFLKYQFIYDDIKAKYKQREDHKNNYATTKKEITSKEKQLKSLNKKINNKGIFSKKEKQEKQIAQYNETINQIQELYKQLDEEEIYQKIIANLNDDSTIFDVLYFSSKFTNYLTECIINNNKTITQPEIDELINELREFLSNPYIIIIKNITILEDKNIPMIISDRYKLLNFNIEKEDIIESNIDTLISGLQKIKNYYNFQKAGIDLEKMRFICEAKKILE